MPSHLKVKICGIRNVESAQAAASAGADFLGFNFVPGFRREVTVELAQEIIKSLDSKSRPKLAGVFMDQPVDFIKNITSLLPLDYVQLHGQESPEFCSKVGLPVIKAFGLESDFNPQKVLLQMKAYDVDIYMVDRVKRGEGGLLNLEKVAELTDHFRIMLAGGLMPENVGQAVKIAKPYAVDVAGGVETNGEADILKIKDFILRAKSA